MDCPKCAEPVKQKRAVTYSQERGWHLDCVKLTLQTVALSTVADHCPGCGLVGGELGTLRDAALRRWHLGGGRCVQRALGAV